jgi:hypothetical protein
MTTPKPLSPAAQAVRDAFTSAACGSTYQWNKGIAAAICALADEVVPEHDCEDVDSEEWLGQSASNQARFRCRFKMLSIAAELEGGNTHEVTDD